VLSAVLKIPEPVIEKFSELDGSMAAKRRNFCIFVAPQKSEI